MGVRWRMARMLGSAWQVLPPYWRVRAYHRLVKNPFAPDVFKGTGVTRRIEPHGFRMALDLGDWMERFAAILGIFYEVEVTRTIEMLVPGGTDFVDIGGNLGFTSLIAAHCVGKDGRVVYVEPNPALVARFSKTVGDNAIANVTIVAAAFGSAPGTLMLAVAGHHGQSALHETAVAGSTAVAVAVVDETSVLPHLTDGRPCFIKIDVEGFEEIVLEGMPQLRDRPDTSFLIELTDAWLKRNGGSADRLWQTMARHGFRGYLPRLSAWSGQVRLEEIDRPPAAFQSDVLFKR